jgi:hypothetical protein
MLTMSTAVPSAALLRPFGGLPLRVPVGLEASGRGASQDHAARGFEAWPAARIEQGARFSKRTLKVLAIPLTPPPAQLNPSALFPGLDSF